eukprot:2736029-Pleurochrysis_carterae.AAC.1
MQTDVNGMSLSIMPTSEKVKATCCSSPPLPRRPQSSTRPRRSPSLPSPELPWISGAAEALAASTHCCRWLPPAASEATIGLARLQPARVAHLPRVLLNARKRQQTAAEGIQRVVIRHRANRRNCSCLGTSHLAFRILAVWGQKQIALLRQN